MIKRLLILLGMGLVLLTQSVLAGSSGLLFEVVSTGTPDQISITLCLNGKGPLSCQNYTVQALTLSILTTIPNHTYPFAGIKINTPGYVINNGDADCTPYTNGYCLFSVSNTVSSTIILQKAGTVPMVAAGSYQGRAAFYPLIATGIDSGASWAYTLDGATPTNFFT